MGETLPSGEDGYRDVYWIAVYIVTQGKTRVYYYPVLKSAAV